MHIQSFSTVKKKTAQNTGKLQCAIQRLLVGFVHSSLSLLRKFTHVLPFEEKDYSEHKRRTVFPLCTEWYLYTTQSSGTGECKDTHSPSVTDMRMSF